MRGSRCGWITAGILNLIPALLIRAESGEWAETLLAKRIFDELLDTPLPGLYKKGDWGVRFRPRTGEFVDADIESAA